MPTDLIATVADRVEADKTLDSAADLRALLLSVPELRRLVVAAGIRALGAQRCHYDKQEEKMIYESDGATQMKAAIFLAAYSDGMPAKTVVNVNLPGRGNGQDDAMTIEATLRRSPALIDALEKQIRRAKQAAPGARLVAQAAGSEVTVLDD